MSAPTAGPRCPRCRRPLAAWRLDHCVYCGEAFPGELKQGHEAPDGLKWVERPALPTDLSKKLELMKVVPIEAGRKSRSLVTIVGRPVGADLRRDLLSAVHDDPAACPPARASSSCSAGAGFVAYLVWIFARARK